MKLDSYTKVNESYQRSGFIGKIKQPTILVISLLGVLMMLIWLSSMTGGRLDPGEASFAHASTNFTGILTNPLNLFQKLLTFISVNLFGNSAFAVRLPSVLLAGTAVWLFGSILGGWFNKYSVFFSTILFASSLWLLHFGRLGSPDVGIVVAILAILFSVTRVAQIKQSVNRFWLVAGLALLFGFSFYIPGCWLIWTVFLLWQRRKLVVLVRRLPQSARLLGGAVIVLLLTPFFIALFNHEGFFTNWLGLASGFNFDSIGQQIWQWFSALFVLGPKLPSSRWLDGQTVLSVFEIVLLVVGATNYVRNQKLKQARAVGLLLAAGFVLAIVSQQALFSFTIAPVFLLVAAGMSSLLSRWHAVFPRNPLALGVGVFLIGLACAATVVFSTRSYFVAWRNSPLTSETYRLKY